MSIRNLRFGDRGHRIFGNGTSEPWPTSSSHASVKQAALATGAGWSGKRDSNPRPSAWKADALATELFPPDPAPPAASICDGGGGGFEPPKASADRFTVCSLWPLGNPSTKTRECHGAHHRRVAPSRSAVHSTTDDNQAGEGTRTPNRLITNEMLYQLSYASASDPQMIRRLSLLPGIRRHRERTDVLEHRVDLFLTSGSYPRPACCPCRCGSLRAAARRCARSCTRRRCDSAARIERRRSGSVTLPQRTVTEDAPLLVDLISERDARVGRTRRRHRRGGRLGRGRRSRARSGRR